MPWVCRGCRRDVSAERVTRVPGAKAWRHYKPAAEGAPRGAEGEVCGPVSFVDEKTHRQGMMLGHLGGGGTCEP